MKSIYLSLVLLIFFSCKETNNASKIDDATVSIVNFDWLIDDWQRTNDDDGNQTFESWQKLSDIDYQGHGITLKGSDTTFMEDMHLFRRDNIWQLEIVSLGEDINTSFEITEYDSLSFTCQNMENEFPTHIQYSYKNDTINAVVWSAEMKIPFQFVKR